MQHASVEITVKSSNRRCILINGATYNDVFKHRTKINKAILKRPKLTRKQSTRKCVQNS